jgi:hypothetical protein
MMENLFMNVAGAGKLPQKKGFVIVQIANVRWKMGKKF